MSKTQNRGAALRSCFNSLTGTGFSCIKALELYQSLSCALTAVVSADTVEEFSAKYGQLFRSVLRELAHSNTAPRLLVVLSSTIRSSDSDEENNQSAVAEQISETLKAVYAEERESTSASELSVTVVSAEDATTAVQSLLSTAQAEATGGSVLTGADISQKWSVISKSSVPHLDKVCTIFFVVV